jgi:hypothetical protein
MRKYEGFEVIDSGVRSVILCSSEPYWGVARNFLDKRGLDYVECLFFYPEHFEGIKVLKDEDLDLLDKLD